MITDLIVTRDASLPPPPLVMPSDFTPHAIERTSDDGFALLNQLYQSQGFPEKWAARMLEHGAVAVVIAAAQAAVASGFLSRQPFYVQEIRRTFDAGPRADYYLGDYVVPAFRGRQLQRHLIRMRLDMTRKSGRQWAIAMTRATIPASLANYEAEGFAVAATLCKRSIWGWELERRRTCKPTLPTGRLSEEGLALPGGLRLRRSI